MLDGFALLFGEIAALLVVSALLGAIAGHWLWPRRARRPRSEPREPIATVLPHGPSAASGPALRAADQEAAAAAGPADADPSIAELERRLRASRAEVFTLQAEALRLKAAVTAVADRKDAEMGRLETAAIEALDSLIASHQTRMDSVEEEARTAVAASRQYERDLEDERRRVQRLQTALAERDERVAALRAELADREQRIQSLRAGTVPPG